HYVLDLKVHPDHRRGRTAYRLLREVNRRLRGRATYNLMVSANRAALGVVSGRATLRQYERVDVVRHFTWPVTLPSRPSRRFEVIDADDAAWSACYEQWKASRNFVSAGIPTKCDGERRYLATRGGRALAIGAATFEDGRRNVPIRLSRRDRAV